MAFLWSRCLPLLFIFHFSLFTSFAQEYRPWEQYLNEVMTAEDAGSSAWEQTYELLCELEQHPLNINHATREQLEELPFLSAQQVEGIMAYLWLYGRMESLGELMMVSELDYPYGNLCFKRRYRRCKRSYRLRHFRICSISGN